MRHFSFLLLASCLASTAFAQPAPSPSNSPPVMNNGLPSQEIGFDAKVKRDPNGKVIDEKATTSTPANPETTLRNDKKLRSDTDILKKSEPTQNPSAPAAGSNQPGMPGSNAKASALPQR